MRGEGKEEGGREEEGEARLGWVVVVAVVVVILPPQTSPRRLVSDDGLFLLWHWLCTNILVPLIVIPVIDRGGHADSVR